MRCSFSAAAGSAALLAILSADPASSAVEAVDVTLLGSFPVTDYEPWVADCWGFVDSQSREFALLPTGNSLRVLDVSDPSNIIEASRIDAPPTASDMKDTKYWNGYAYANQEFGDIVIVDVSDPYNATQVGAIPQGDLCSPSPCSFEFDGGAHNIYIDERGYLFVLGVHWSSTLIYDLTVDPTDPPLVATYNPGYIHDIHVQNGIAYVSSSSHGEWEVVDMSDVTNPQVLGSMAPASVGYAHAGWATEDGNYFISADESAGGHAFIFDISDPANAFEVAEYQVADGEGSSIHNIHIRGDFVYISYYEKGLRVLDISDPTNPVEVGAYRDDAWDNDSCSFSVYRGIWGVYAFAPSGNIYVSEMCGGGLHVLDFGGDDEPAGIDDYGQFDRIQLSVSPNPSVSDTAIRARFEQDGVATLRVFDANGRIVRTLAQAEAVDAGLRTWEWDGRDELGSEAPAGIYYVKAEQGRRTVSSKLVRLD